MNTLDLFEASIISVASKTTYGGAATSLVAWWANVDWLSILGAVVAIVNLLINFYFRYKRDQREGRIRMREHAKEMRRLDTESQAKIDLMGQGIDPDKPYTGKY